MERREAGELESGSGVAKEVALESPLDKGEEGTGELENYPEEPKSCEEDNCTDETFEFEEEEVGGENFDPVNNRFHFID